MSDDGAIDYGGIPAVDGKGYTTLQIYPPGTWMGSPDFCVFVGGGGVGHRSTLKDAEALLVDYAKVYCERQIRNAQALVGHYSEQLRKLSMTSNALVSGVMLTSGKKPKRRIR